MTDTADSAPDVTTEATPTEEPIAPPAPQVDLAKEAGEVAASDEAASGRKPRSLDEIDLEGEVRSQVESYVSKAVNEAITKHDDRSKQRLDDEGYMSRSQIEELMEQKDTEYQRRDEAKERFLTVLGEQKIDVGSDDYAEVQNFYKRSVENGTITPHILLTEGGIRTLIAMSGVSKTGEAAGPQSGLSRSAPAPDGSVRWADGSVQINANTGEGLSLDEKVRLEMQRSMEGQ